ncbi:hypothetical protein ADUPG1_004229, partial [Aduncisulcus paluster]
HSCVEDLFEANSDHADDTVSPVLFSVASLKTLVTGFDDTPVLSCSDANVSDLAGIEHLTEITLIDLSSNSNISDASDLSKLTKLESLSLNSTSIDELPNLSLLTNLTILDVSFTDVALPY